MHHDRYDFIGEKLWALTDWEGELRNAVSGKAMATLVEMSR